jgi:hypothetical protein
LDLLVPQQRRTAPSRGLRSKIQTYYYIAKLAFSGQGNTAHQEETYMQHLVELIATVSEDPRISGALTKVKELLAGYGDVR